MLYDPERRWIDRGACKSVDPRVFFPDSPQPGKPPTEEVQEKWDAAKRVCARCPVLEECRRDTLGEDFGVWGGLDERERWRLRRSLVKWSHKHWDDATRAAWAKEVHALRGQGVSWTRIKSMTGINPVLAERLADQHTEHLAARRRELAQKVVDLPLPGAPEDVIAKKPFPEGIGRRHCWVRHNGIVADSYYRAETSDGEWIFVQIKAGRGNSLKWVRREDVKIYHPQPRMVQPYINRPDAAEKRGLSA